MAARTRRDSWYNYLFSPFGGVPDLIKGAVNDGWRGVWNAYKRGGFPIDTFDEETDTLLNELGSSVSGDTGAFWNSLSELQQKELLDKYFKTDNDISNLWGLAGDYEVFNEDRFLQDLEEAVEMREAYAALGEAPDYQTYLDAAREQIASENAEMYADLDRLLASQTGLYNQQMSNLADNFNTSRADLLSQQYQQNAQLMDTLQSGMERSRRNALEAGASAGIRIADNINTLLSVQNKQSATSMETANQLSQMMVNQRNAESSIRGAYSDTLAQDTSKRHNIKMGSESRATSLANTNYGAASESYGNEEERLDNYYGTSNPMYEYRNYKNKPKYNSNIGG